MRKRNCVDVAASHEGHLLLPQINVSQVLKIRITSLSVHFQKVYVEEVVSCI